jgi:membrane protein YqaA with SNARE-associated domain
MKSSAPDGWLVAASSIMRAIAAALFAFVLKFGGVGLLVLGVLDSSYLFVPWGNDLLLVALTVRHPTLLFISYYAAMSAAGSVLGCFLIDIGLRPLGAAGLEKHLPKRRVKSIQKQVERNAGLAVAIASLAPPPFPFTAFIMAAAALQYSRRRLLAVVGVTRMLRFSLLGLLAWRFGSRILKWTQNPVVQTFLVGLILICTVGSVISVYSWIRRSKSASGAPKRDKRHRSVSDRRSVSKVQ